MAGEKPLKDRVRTKCIQKLIGVKVIREAKDCHGKQVDRMSANRAQSIARKILV